MVLPTHQKLSDLFVKLDGAMANAMIDKDIYWKKYYQNALLLMRRAWWIALVF